MDLKKEVVELDSLVLEHLHKYYDLYVSKCTGAKSFNYWLSCVLVNRLIDLDILTDFGLPNPFIFPPKIDLSTCLFNEQVGEEFSEPELGVGDCEIIDDELVYHDTELKNDR